MGSANSRNKNWGKAGTPVPFPERGTLREMILSRPASHPYPVWPCGCHGSLLSVHKMRCLVLCPCLNVGGSAVGAAASCAAGHSVPTVPVQGQCRRHAGAVLVVVSSWARCCCRGRWQHPPASSANPSARCHQARRAVRAPGTLTGTGPSFTPTRGECAGTHEEGRCWDRLPRDPQPSRHAGNDAQDIKFPVL